MAILRPEPDHSAAHITRVLEDGTAEEVMGGVERDGHGNWRIILNGDFSGKLAEFGDTFDGPSEVETYPLLHVRSEHGWFTAVSSRVISRRRHFGGSKLSRVVLRPRYFIEGQARLNADELSLTQATVRFDAQPDWTEQESWVLGSDYKSVERVKRDDLTASFEGVKLVLVDRGGWTSASETHSWSLFSATDFVYTFDEPVTLDEFFESWFRPLVFLLTTGVKHRVRVERFVIANSSWVSEDGSPMDDLWLTVHVQNPERKDRSEQRMLHHLSDFDFARQIPQVFAVYRDHHDAMEQLLDLVHSRLTSPRVRLIATAQMVESFDRSLTPDPEVDEVLRALAESASELMSGRNDLAGYAAATRRSILESVRPSFASRLSRLDSEAGNFISGLVGQRQWKNDVQLVRNTVVHGLARVDFFTKNVIPLQVSADLLDVLFEVRLLVAFGFTAEGAKRVLESDPHWWQATQGIVPYMDVFRTFDR